MPLRVLVVGSGLAGLTTAYLLRREGCEVWIVEKSEQIGFHSSSISIPLPSGAGKQGGYGEENWENWESGEGGREWVVDVPMRSFQGGYYPLLIALYRHLGLPLTPGHFTFSFSHLPPPSRSFLPTRPAQPPSTTSKQSTYFIYSGASGLSLPSLPFAAFHSLFSLGHALLHFAAFGIIYLLLLALAFISWHSLFPLPRNFNSLFTITSYLPLGLGGVVEGFVMDVVVPLFSAVGTMTSLDVLEMPLKTVLEYVHSTVGTPHYTLGGCSARDVARLLVRPVEKQGDGYVRLGEEIVSMDVSKSAAAAREDQPSALSRRSRTSTSTSSARECGDQSRSEIVVKLKDSGEIPVDKVVIATQASAALSLLGLLRGEDELLVHEQRRTERIKSALRQVEYRDTIVVTHRDRSVLPHAADVRDINLVFPVLPFPSSDPNHNNENTADTDDTPLLSPTATSSASRSPSPLTSELRTPVDCTQHQLGIPFFRPRRGVVYTMGTHVIQPPRGMEDMGEVMQSTNPVVPIDASAVLGIARLERALPLQNPDTTLSELYIPSEVGGSGSSKVHLVGSYAYPGIPLLEGCVGSARRAVREILEEEERRGGEMAVKGGSGSRRLVGGVDWSAGEGSLVGRVWRWKRRSSAWD